MKVYTFYTDSHQQLLNDWFLPSFNETNKNMELIITKFDQQCKSGVYMSDGWMKSMHDKVDLIIRGIEENWNEYFIHADCDIQFFGDIEKDIFEQIENEDILGIDDNPIDRNSEICCGFLVCKGNDKTLSVFKKVKELMSGQYHDQFVFNKIKNNFVSSKKLDFKYYEITHGNGPIIWDPSIPILKLNKNILVHHANWTMGVDNKIKMLETVKGLVNGN